MGRAGRADCAGVSEDEFAQKTVELANKIEKETSTLSTKIEETKNVLLETADILFDRKFYRTTGIIIGAIPMLYGAVSSLQNSTLGGDVITGIAFAVGLLIWIVSFVLTKKR